MYHPTRGGVRGGKDQFSWDDVKVDKHRENYLGHSIKAPVGRWQKGKDLHWYTRDKGSRGSGSDALKEEIKRIKEEEEQAMREALGLAPKRSGRPQGNRLDKHEFQELVKRSSTAEDLGAGHADAAWVHGIGFSRGAPRPWEDPSTLQSSLAEVSSEMEKPVDHSPPPPNIKKEESEDENRQKKRRHEEKKHEKHEKREKRHSRDSDDRRKHKKDKEKRRRHDSD